MQRYRFYREHKFIIPLINDITRKIASTNFQNNEEISLLIKKLSNLQLVLTKYSEHEDKAYHSLLVNKGSNIHYDLENDHNDYEKKFCDLKNLLKIIKDLKNKKEKIAYGYKFYLNFREFEVKNAIHMNNEELYIMPKLQQLYSDDELQAIELKTYKLMKVSEIIHMMKTIFIYMDANDRLHYFNDINKSSPEKIKPILCSILKIKKNNSYLISKKEKYFLLNYFSISKEEYKNINVEDKNKYLWELSEGEFIEENMSMKSQHDPTRKY